MAAVDIGARNSPPVSAADDLDDLFDYDVFHDVDTNMDAPVTQQPAVVVNGNENVAGLGIDEEIKVTKKRAPAPKLDENRLLSSAGIPKLRRTTKDRLKFKGKRHEYADVARLLNFYQLWLDELYPRAKFADGLAIIEKLGHTKRLQTMRREWINEGKPSEPREMLGSVESIAQKLEIKQQGSGLRQDQSPAAKPTPRQEKPVGIDHDDEDFHIATPKPARRDAVSKSVVPPTETLFVSDDEDLGDQPPNDDLDALLVDDDAKQEPNTRITPLESPSSLGREESFDDEMEVMAAMDNMW